LRLAPGALRRARLILVAEDNPIHLKLTTRQLKGLGYEVQAVSDGRAAVAAVCSGGARYDLILMDCQMPVADGYEAAVAIRRWEAGRSVPARVPIIAMTAGARASDREKCTAAGMDELVGKPIHWECLSGVLERWLPSRAGAREAGVPLVGSWPVAPECPDDLDQGAVGDLHDLAVCTSEAEVRALVAMFLRGLPGRMWSVHVAVAAGDTLALEREAHALKGSSASFGALGLAVVCHELENLARTGDMACADGFLTILHDECQRAEAALQAEFGLG
jgi:CheY-like chemotaxis protein/HPt (histidine-containing phosphotransfer) domain-containing protein